MFAPSRQVSVAAVNMIFGRVISFNSLFSAIQIAQISVSCVLQYCNVPTGEAKDYLSATCNIVEYTIKPEMRLSTVNVEHP